MEYLTVYALGVMWNAIAAAFANEDWHENPGHFWLNALIWPISLPGIVISGIACWSFNQIAKHKERNQL